MARIVSIFQFTGRAGSAVGSKSKGGKASQGYDLNLVDNPSYKRSLQPECHDHRDFFVFQMVAVSEKITTFAPRNLFSPM